MGTGIGYIPSTEDDARNRAWRSILQGLGIDVTTGVLLAVVPLVMGSDFAFTAAYWAALGLVVAKSAVQSVVSYFARKLLPPKP